MAENLILTTVSTKEVRLKPGGVPASFDVNVINDSPGFASFQVELLAAGADEDITHDWYKISPNVSSKKPTGDVTDFHVSIIDTPIPGFVGLLSVTVRVFSMELRDEDRVPIRVVVEQGNTMPAVKLSLPTGEFNVYPGDQVEMPVVAHNPSQLNALVTLSFVGLDPAWLVGGIEQSLQIPAGKRVQTSFVCQPAASNKSVSQIYLFTIKASQNNGPSSETSGRLEVRAIGFLETICQPKKQSLPNKTSWAFWRSDPVTYLISLKNSSNLRQSVSVKIEADEEYKCNLELEQNTAELEADETGELLLKAQKRRPWVAREQKLLLEVQTVWSDQRVETRNSNQTLELKVKPVLPNWFLALGTLGILWLAWWASWLNPDNTRYGHQDAVTSVQFNGFGRSLISSSSDQTTRRWKIEGFFSSLINPEIGVIEKVDKAVRVIRHKPVNNDQVAGGLENGAIYLWDLLGDDAIFKQSFFYEKDDRVMSLDFTQGSRFLFSGHGSGMVLQWKLLEDSPPPPSDSGSIIRQTPEQRGEVSSKQPAKKKQLGFAVYALKLAGKDDSNLVIGGRYNQLAVWNWVEDKLQSIPYPRQGSQNDYIFSIDIAESKPNLMVTSDNQGYITLWDMEKCFTNPTKCKPLDEWSGGHGGQAVRTVALSPNGCYLASGGDDGRVLLWYLGSDGRLSSPKSKEVIKSFDGKKINSTDIRLTKKYVLIASGSDDTQVRVNKSERISQGGCDRP
ncbi:hypothetical protein [Ancylothrix sp. D3o]|uniref:hypothetical protein n=1 Tax=Ancylothrix sp. D3o TaxID=2953691 RepID=UPI0021BA4534|nr:hypothetical protein [Ancylothrix sp. D3o]